MRQNMNKTVKMAAAIKLTSTLTSMTQKYNGGVVELGCDVMGVGKMLLESAFSFVKKDVCLIRRTRKPKSLNDDYKQVL